MDTEIALMFAKINQTFTPSAPIDDSKLFAGRTRQLREIIDAASQKGRHAIVFGERGVGKTSLANVLTALAPSIMKAITVKVNCESASEFSAIWRAVFKNFVLSTQRQTIGYSESHTFESALATNLLPSGEITPEDIHYALSRLPGPTMIVIDELDRIRSTQTIASLADTLKTLSDNASPSTLILIGVADSVDDLIQEHNSIERALVQIHMPRMSATELHEIIDKGLQEVEINIEPGARSRIASLSQGLPHYTHFLCLNSCKNAVLNERTEINSKDVKTAVDKVVESAQQSIKRFYHTATISTRENLFSQVLLSCALAECDQLGYFSASDIRKPLSIVTHREYEIPAFSRHLNEFCDKKRGSILQRTGHPRRYRFRFTNPLISPYVIMKGLSSGLINDSALIKSVI